MNQETLGNPEDSWDGYLEAETGEDDDEGFDESYQFFGYGKERDELFEYSKRVAEYIHENGIANLVIIDRSSRPLYVSVLEYWKAKYGNEERPGMYFMNPKGFKAREDCSPRELEDICEDARWKDDAAESPSQARSRDEILAELRETYKFLLKDKDKPLLVFDSCIHSGDTLSPVRDILEEEGFAKIIIGSINPAEDSDGRVETDFHITEERPEKGCYPFDRDRLIEKTFDHVYSKKTKNHRKAQEAIQLRKEIKRVMQEKLKAQQEG